MIKARGFQQKKLAAAVTVAVAGMCMQPAVVLAQDEVFLEEVIVTATRRAQSIQDIPFNISAIGGDYIAEAGLLDATELMREIAGVTVSDGGARAAETNANVNCHSIEFL